MGWEQHQADDRARGADAGGEEAGCAEAVEESVGRCCVDGVRECGVALKAGAVGELERGAGGVVGGAREPRSQFTGRCRAEIRASKLAIRPHDCRHSWISHLRAAGIDDADLADVAGHTVETMIGTYTHALGRSHDRIRGLIG
jgi:hypothetical protein